MSHLILSKEFNGKKNQIVNLWIRLNVINAVFYILRHSQFVKYLINYNYTDIRCRIFIYQFLYKIKTNHNAHNLQIIFQWTLLETSLANRFPNAFYYCCPSVGHKNSVGTDPALLRLLLFISRAQIA